MTNKPTIKQTVVVEGKTDTAKLQKLFNVTTIETGGFALSAPIMNLITQAQAATGIILCLDPDGPGEQLRKRILDQLTTPCLNVFIKKTDMRATTKKIGIAEADDQALLLAFESLVSFDPMKQLSISWDDYCVLALNTRQKRQLITDHYHIMPCNHKRLFKCLNMLKITKQELVKLLK